MTATPDDTSQTNAPAGIVASDACSARLFATHDIPTDRWQPMLTVAHQTIGFGPLCETEGEAHWWCDQMRKALGRAGCRVDFSCRWSENEDGNWDTDKDGWIPHKPGNPMPCEEGSRNRILLRNCVMLTTIYPEDFEWGEIPHRADEEIIAWKPFE